MRCDELIFKGAQPCNLALGAALIAGARGAEGAREGRQFPRANIVGALNRPPVVPEAGESLERAHVSRFPG